MVINDKEVGDGSKMETDYTPDAPVKRKTVVVVGLGMVGLAFMCVSLPKAVCPAKCYIVRNYSSSMPRDANMMWSSLEKKHISLIIAWA